MSATTTSSPVLSRALNRSASIRTGLDADSSSRARRAAGSVLAAAALVATTALVLVGALLGGRSYVDAADTAGLVQQPVAVVSTAASVSEERADVTTSRRV